MKTSEKLQTVIAQEGAKLVNSPEFLKLQQFYNEMKSKGLVIEPEYKLPPLDTIGRNVYHKISSNSL